MQNSHVLPERSPKLSVKWVGPFSILELGPNHTYKLQHSQTNKTHKAFIHANRLKLHVSRPPNGRLPDAIPTPGHHSPIPSTSADANHLPDKQTLTSEPNITDNTTTDEQEPESNKHGQTYPVDRILGCKTINGRKHYHIKWVGYSETTWEPSYNLPQSLINYFHKSWTMSGSRRKRGRKYFK